MEAPTNKVTEVYAYICQEISTSPSGEWPTVGEGIPAAHLPNGIVVACVFTNMINGKNSLRAKFFRVAAQKAANKTGKPVELRRFVLSEVIETINPE